VRILLLCSAFNGLSQRAWIDLRADGHDVLVRLAGDADTICATVADVDPDIIICPFLRERVPEQVWARYRTIIVHPGPPGDRGPSSLDWAITDAATTWGVTALQAVEEMDAGPIWAVRTFAVPARAPRKSGVYNGPVADAAVEVIRDVVDNAHDPSFQPKPAAAMGSATDGRSRPLMRQSDRAFAWYESTDHILRRIRAADGSPGVRTTLCGQPVSVFDAHRGPAIAGVPGAVAGRRHGAVLVRTGNGAVWIGHVRPRHPGASPVKLPATVALAGWLDRVPEVLDAGHDDADAAPVEVEYRRHGPVGVLRFDFYNGAMSTSQCRRLSSALAHATAQTTRVLVLRGGSTFSNGIHLNVIEAAADPAMEAWRNINAIDDVCRQIITCTDQLVIASVAGGAGAGGVMLALGADHVVLRDSAVLNPHYATMGLFGSEYWTYVLPRRVGDDHALLLTRQCLPIGAAEAARIGLVDEVLPGPQDAFEAAVLDRATGLAASADYALRLHAKRRRRAADERTRPLDAYRDHELAEMSRDMFDDRHGFAAARRAFVTKQRPARTPPHLLALADNGLAAAAPPVGQAIGAQIEPSLAPTGDREPYSTSAVG
jgi:putative two-component system hydrogenase maturation factor HypX/HoxX